MVDFQLQVRMAESSPTPESQVFVANTDKLVLELRSSYPAAIDFCISKFILSNDEVDFRFTYGMPDGEKVRRLLDILHYKIARKPDVMNTFVSYLKSSIVHGPFGTELGKVLLIIIALTILNLYGSIKLCII